MKLTAALIKKVALVVIGQEKDGYETVFTDSRTESKDSLFIPLVGERFDGHDFIGNAIKNGAGGAIWQKDHPIPAVIPADFPLYLVENSLQALQQLATEYLNEVKPIVIGITGSNGKTSTKDIVKTILSVKYRTHKTAGNFNNHIGMPLTILSMPNDCECLILEMGMSGFGEISLLSKIAKPDYAIVTNIGESHIEQLGSREGIAKAKMEIMDGLASNGKVFIDGDELLLRPYKDNQKTVTCGYNEENTYFISSYDGNKDGYSFHINKMSEPFIVPLLGKHNVQNATYAIALAKELSIDDKQIKEALMHVELTGMRLQKQRGLNDSVLINDAYNASPTSMKAAIEAVRDLAGFSKKILVLGDMYELGTNEEVLHRSVATAIVEPITHVFTVGNKGKWIMDELRQRSSNTMVIASFLNKEEVLHEIKGLLNRDTVVLFKASRGMKLETVMTELLIEGRENHC